MEQQQISPKKQKALDKVKRANAELAATSAKYTRSQYYDLRFVTRTEADKPEGMLGYDADEVVRKADAAKAEKEAV